MRILIVKLILISWWGLALAQGPGASKIVCAYPAAGTALPSGCQAAQMVQLGVPGGLITYTISGRLRTLNPIVALDQASREISRALHAGLLEGTAISPEPAITSRFTQSPDRTAVTFVLRPGVRFSDGTPVSTEDVRFTFENLIYPREIVTPWRDAVRCADGALPTITTVSSQEIRFLCATPIGPWQLWQIGSVPILPKQKLQRYERDPVGFHNAWGLQTPPSQMAGLGPFRLEGVSQDKISLKRNEYYWKRDIRGTTLPYLSGITVLIGSPELALQRFRSRETHFFYPRPADLPLLQSDKISGRLILNDDLSTGQAAFGGQFLVVNWDATQPALRAVFRAPEFRRALSHAVPRAQMLKEILLGAGVELYGPLSPASPYFVGRPGQDPKILERFHALRTPFDLAKATQILDELGLIDTNRDGVREIPKNFLGQGNPAGRLEFELMAPPIGPISPEALARLLLPAFAQLGIKIRLVTAGEDFLNRLMKGQYEMALVGWDGTGRLAEGLSDSLPDSLMMQRATWLCLGSLHLFHPACAQQPTEFERRLDELLLRAEPASAHDEAQLLIMEALPVIPLVQVHALLAYRVDVLRNHERRPTLKLDVLFCERGTC